jgi:hypothetical protein
MLFIRDDIINSLNASISNVYEWNGIWEKTGEVNRIKAYAATDGTSHRFSIGTI